MKSQPAQFRSSNSRGSESQATCPSASIGSETSSGQSVAAASLFAAGTPALAHPQPVIPAPLQAPPTLQRNAEDYQRPRVDLAKINIFAGGSKPHPTSVAIQPQLTMGDQGDRYEPEADRMADGVVQRIQTPAAPPNNANPWAGSFLASPSPQLQRQAEGNASVAPDLEETIQASRGKGQPIEDGVRQPMEQAFGADFSRVRIHADSQAHHLSTSIQAKAFTTGQDVFFRQGAYSPGSRSGQHLLAHELTHVVQQNGATLQRQPLGRSDWIQRDEAAPAPKSPGMPPSTTVTVSMSGLEFLPVEGSTYQAGAKAPQAFEMIVYGLVGISQYSPGLVASLAKEFGSLGEFGHLVGQAKAGEPIRKFHLPLAATLKLITVIQQRKLTLTLPEERLDLLHYGFLGKSAWADLKLPEVKAYLNGIELPPWYNETIFQQEMSRHAALLRQYGEAGAEYAKDRKDNWKKQDWKESLQAIILPLEERAAYLEGIRTDPALVDHPVYQMIWPTAAPGAKGAKAAKPTMAPASKTPNEVNAFFRFVSTQSQLAFDSQTDDKARRELLERFGRYLGRVSSLQKDGDQSVLDTPATANALPFPSRLSVYPNLMGQLKLEGQTDVAYRFIMDLSFADVFDAFTNIEYLWEYMRVPDEQMPAKTAAPSEAKSSSEGTADSSADATDVSTVDSASIASSDPSDATEVTTVATEVAAPPAAPTPTAAPASLKPLDFDKHAQAASGATAMEFGRQVDYAVEDVATLFEDWGPAGVGAMPLVAINRILGFVGTGLKSLVRVLTKPLSQEDFSFSEPGVYLVRCKAIPRYDMDNNPEVIRPPSVAFQPILVRRPADIVEMNAKAQALAKENDLARMYDLQALVAEPVSHENQEALEKELDQLERSLVSVGGAIAVQMEQLRSYAQTLPADSVEAEKVKTQLEHLAKVLELRQKRGEEHNLNQAEPLTAHFTSDEGQEMPLRLEAVLKSQTDDQYSYWVSDLTTPDSGEGEGSGATRSGALMEAVEDLLSDANYGRGHVAVNLDGVTYSRRIKSSATKLVVEESLESLSMAISIAAIAAAPLTGGASLILMAPAAVIGGIPSAYRLIERGSESTLRFDLATVMDVVNLVSGVSMVGQAAARSLKLVNLGQGLMIAGIGADGLGMMLIPADILHQINQLRQQGLPDSLLHAQITVVLGQAMINAGINLGEAVVRHGMQRQMASPYSGTDSSTSGTTHSNGAEHTSGSDGSGSTIPAHGSSDPTTSQSGGNAPPSRAGGNAPPSHGGGGKKPPSSPYADGIKTFTALGNQANVIVGNRLPTADAGHAILDRLRDGDAQALTDIGMSEIPPDYDPRGSEWALNQLPDGNYVIIKGAFGGVDPQPGAKHLAHTHPLADHKLLKGKAATGISIDDLFKGGELLNRTNVLPSAADIKFCAQEKMNGHVVHTPYVSLGQGLIGNPTPGIKGAGVSFEIRHPESVGHWVGTEIPVFKSELVARSGGEVIWQGEVYAIDHPNIGSMVQREPFDLEPGSSPAGSYQPPPSAPPSGGGVPPIHSSGGSPSVHSESHPPVPSDSTSTSHHSGDATPAKDTHAQPGGMATEVKVPAPDQIKQMAANGVPISFPDPQARQRAEQAVTAGHASQHDIQLLIQQAVADARTYIESRRASVGESQALTSEAMKLTCGPGRDISVASLGSLLRYSPTPAMIKRFQAGDLFPDSKHGFSVITVEGQPPVQYLVDPTFVQFVGTQGTTAQATARLRATPEGAAMIDRLLRDGFIPLTEQTATLYAQAFGVAPETSASLGKHLLQGTNAVTTEPVGGQKQQGAIVSEPSNGADIIDATESLHFLQQLIASPQVSSEQRSRLQEMTSRLQAMVDAANNPPPTSGSPPSSGGGGSPPSQVSGSSASGSQPISLEDPRSQSQEIEAAIAEEVGPEPDTAGSQPISLEDPHSQSQEIETAIAEEVGPEPDTAGSQPIQIEDSPAAALPWREIDPSVITTHVEELKLNQDIFNIIVEFKATVDGQEVKWGTASMSFDHAGQLEAPELDLNTRVEVNGQTVILDLPGNQSFTRIALEGAIAEYQKRTGHKPASLPGLLGHKNLLNFQRAYTQIRAQHPDWSRNAIAQAAVGQTSFGHHRQNLGYGEFDATIGQDVEVDLGDSLGKQQVPGFVTVNAKPSKKAPK